MPEYLSPGVYMEEVSTGAKPIGGVPTSTGAFVGRTERGPMDEPVRLAGWNDFLTRFGDYLPEQDRGFTPEAVFGFFENGGAACYVVRVADGSATVRWPVHDESEDELFRVRATSPGRWAERIGLEVFSEVEGGRGELFAASVEGPASLTADTPADLRVADATGARAGDELTVSIPGGADDGAVSVERVDVAARRLTVVSDSALEIPVGAWLVDTLGADATEVRLASGSGFLPGDVIQARGSDGAIHTAVVTDVESTGVGLELEVADGFGQAVPAARLAPRAGGAPVSLYSTEVTLVEGGKSDQLMDAFGFVHSGARLELTAGDGSSVEVTRQGDAFTGVGDLTEAPYTVTFVLDVSNLTDGVLVQASTEPREGDFLALGANAMARITSVETVPEAPGNQVYRLGFDEDLTAGDQPAAGTISFDLHAWHRTTLRPLRFGLRTELLGPEGEVVLTESFEGLSLREEHDRYYLKEDVVNGNSRLVRIEEPASAPTIDGPGSLPSEVGTSTEGADGSLTLASLRRGLDALKETDEPAIVACPDALALEEAMDRAGAVGQLIGHCEEENRFAVVDLPDEEDDQDLLDWRLQYLDSTYAAAYAPFLKIRNPRPRGHRKVLEVPPSGHVMGVFARTDRDRGVHKAPANERLRGIVGLARTYTRGRQDLLNPKGVNLIRQFRGRGTRVWGARNATTDTQWRYVNVRRLFLFLENSIERGTQWVVFEPNSASTWLRVRVSVENFLNQVWRAGGLAGSAPEQAYRVQVGLGETMTETDVDLGKLIIEVGVAPVKPAEFVIFRISHKTLSE